MRRLLGLLAAIVVLLAGRPSAVVTAYYVNAQAVGADNTLCDGLSQGYVSAGHCPFKDLTSVGVRALLQNANSVTFSFCGRGTVYDVGASALVLSGTGNSSAQAVTITNCDNDSPILDGGYTARETVRLSGSYVRVVATAPGSLTVRRPMDYAIECRGAANVEIRGLIIADNFASDLLKGDGGCADATIADNDLSAWVSQCMDLAGVARIAISGNKCHGPKVAGQPGIGCKFECDDVTVSANVIDGAAVGVAMGGVSSTHAGSYEAKRMIVDGNYFYNLTSFAADVYSCVPGCVWRNNHVWSGVAGVRLGGIPAQGQSGCNNGAGSCTPTSGFVASANVLRNLHTSTNNSFWLVNTSEKTGLAIAGSIYCTYAGDATDRYAIDSVIKTRAQWQAGVSTDTDAVIITGPDARCGPHVVVPAAPAIIGIF